MKKKIVSIMLTVMMMASLTTACGGDNKKANTASTANTQTAAPADTRADTPAPADTKSDTPASDDAASATDADVVSDELFAELQNIYDLLVQHYNAVIDLYTDDAIAANPEIDDVLNQARDLIEEMGEITQDTLTVTDAQDLLDAMEIIVDGLNELTDQMELTDDAAAAEGETVSDETFASLQESYEALTTAYNTIAEAYNDGAEENADIVDTMNQAYDIIGQMGEITQDNITEADAEELLNAMLDILEVLSVVADAM